MTEAEKKEFLIEEFCENEDEKKEMISWIDSKGIKEVYDKIWELFYEEEG